MPAPGKSRISLVVSVIEFGRLIAVNLGKSLGRDIWGKILECREMVSHVRIAIAKLLVSFSLFACVTYVTADLGTSQLKCDHKNQKITSTTPGPAQLQLSPDP